MKSEKAFNHLEQKDLLILFFFWIFTQNYNLKLIQDLIISKIK